MTAKSQPTKQAVAVAAQKLDPDIERLNLQPGEEKIHETRTHWIVLLGRIIVPFLVTLFFVSWALYRGIGGTFLAAESRAPQGFDLISWILIVVVGLLVLIWLVLWVRSRKERRTRLIILAIIGMISLIIYYRYEGGRFFFIDPVYASLQIFDGWNIVLFVCIFISLCAVGISAYDWQNDRLILTNRRVILEDDKVYIPRVLERTSQSEVDIDDIQNVSASTKTYAQHWLGYGKIIIKSASYAGGIDFNAASNPSLMQSKIMVEVNAHRKQNSERDFGRMIESSVYGNKPPKPAPPPRIVYTGPWKVVRWLLPENPERNYEKNEVLWRPHWLFMLRGIAWPLLIFTLAVFSIVIGTQFMWFTGPVITVLFLVMLIFCAGWLAWEIEDYRNDLYILTPNSIIDIQKKPFGPEDRRTGQIENIQNVSYTTTFISNFLGYGDVLVETAGSGGKFTFNKVPDPRNVVGIINDYRRQFESGKKERTLNDSLTLLRHYHDAQIKHNELNNGGPNP